MDAADVRGLLALLIADGSLVPYRSPSGGFIQLTLTAGAAHSAYLEEKAAEVRQFLPTSAQIVPYQSALRPSGKRTEVLRFRVSTRKLRPIYHLLYPHGMRQITRDVLEMLGARAAAWLWAEGMRPGKTGVFLARVGQELEEAQLLAGWIETITGVPSVVWSGGIRPRLLFDDSAAARLKGLLRPYAPASRMHLFEP